MHAENFGILLKILRRTVLLLGALIKGRSLEEQIPHTSHFGGEKWLRGAGKKRSLLRSLRPGRAEKRWAGGTHWECLGTATGERRRNSGERGHHEAQRPDFCGFVDKGAIREPSAGRSFEEAVLPYFLERRCPLKRALDSPISPRSKVRDLRGGTKSHLQGLS